MFFKCFFKQLQRLSNDFMIPARAAKTKIIFQLLISTILASFLTSCGSVESRRDSYYFKKERNSSPTVTQSLQSSRKGSRDHIPYHFNSHVQSWIYYFQTRGRSHMEKYLERSSRYLPMMKRELRKNGLTEDLVYIVFVESGFSPRAHSRANAVGYWQFIKQTARMYGLTVNGYIDERRDPILSTRAAIRYFKVLYNLFGDWNLAMAAYNTGENRVKRVIRRYKTRDFWTLARRRKLLRETRNYIPKFLAARLIAKNPEKFGFTHLRFEEEFKFKPYIVTKPLSLKKLSRELNISYKELRRLNPKFKTKYVLPFYKHSKKQTVIRLPLHSPEVTPTILAKSKVKGPFKPASDYLYYRVRKGDSLSQIAMRFRTSYRRLLKANSIRRPSFIRVGQILKIPRVYSSRTSYKTKRRRKQRYKRLQAMNSRFSKGRSKKRPKTHIIRRGESLTSISKKYKVSIAKLTQMNSLKNPSFINTGETLIIPD